MRGQIADIDVGDGGIPSQLHAGRAWPAAPEQYLQLFTVWRISK